MKIVYKLYEVRKEKKMSLRALEIKSGVGKSTINMIENGTGNPTVRVICQLAEALGCSPSDLFYMEK